MNELRILIRVPLAVQVRLPDDVVDDGEGNVTPKARERAWEAFVEALPQDVQVFLDGEDKEPTRVFLEPDESEENVEMSAE
mgnify:CR=1 FL=1